MKKRIQVTINSKLVGDARMMMSVRGFDSFSEFLESLIREESDRRRSLSAHPIDNPALPPVPDTQTATEFHKRKGRKK